MTANSPSAATLSSRHDRVSFASSTYIFLKNRTIPAATASTSPNLNIHNKIFFLRSALFLNISAFVITASSVLFFIMPFFLILTHPKKEDCTYDFYTNNIESLIREWDNLP